MQPTAIGRPTPARASAVGRLARWRARPLSADRVAEVAFLGVLAAVFVYFLVAARAWPIGGGLLPTVAAGVGMLLLLVHVATRLRPSAGPRREILDIGFGSEDVGARERRLRSARMLGSMLLLFAGIWLVGFHVALPAYVFGYLLFFGHVRWWWAAAAALFFEALLLGLYDRYLHTAWNTPVLQQLLAEIGR